VHDPGNVTWDVDDGVPRSAHEGTQAAVPVAVEFFDAGNEAAPGTAVESGDLVAPVER